MNDDTEIAAVCDDCLKWRQTCSLWWTGTIQRAVCRYCRVWADAIESAR